MFLPIRLLLGAILLCGMGLPGMVAAQNGCETPFQYPFGTYTPDPSGLLTEVSTCIYFQEYTHFTGIQSGSTYMFNISGNGYITLREGSVNGPVVATGYAYVVYTATSNADIFAHYTKNAACVFTTSCQTNSVQLLLNCVPPQVWYTWVEDCTTGEFHLDVEVISLGDSPSLNIQYTSPGGSGTSSDVGLGVMQFGPFTLGDAVNISIGHPASSACDINFNGLQPFPSCPILLTCGGTETSIQYCYDINEDVAWSFEGVGEGSILLNFLAGSIGGGDVLTVYDGTDVSAPVLFVHNDWMDLDLTGLSLISTGPAIHVTLITDGWGSCVDNSALPWNITVACLDCTQPQASATIVDDCDNNQFFIEVDVTSTGDGSTVDIEYTVNGGAPITLAGLDIGQTVLGPFTINDVVMVFVRHDEDGMCDISLGALTDGNSCPTLIVCGEDDHQDTYCYGNNDSQFWFYELDGNDGALFLQFNSGSIESATWDQLAIYDGPDANSPLLFQHTGAQLFLAGLSVTSTSGFLYMTMSSDGSVSCVDGFEASWAWTVACLDCTPAVATFGIVQDCENMQYFVDVDLSTIGNMPELTITNTGNAPTVSVTAPGIVQVGPFTSGTPVQITLVNSGNALCNVVSPMLVNPICPTMICGTTPLEETYCYGASENMAWAYEIPGDGQLRLTFQLGTMEPSYSDVLRIHDGPDAQSPVLFEHTNFGTVEFGPQGSAINGQGWFYYGVDVTSTGPNLYMTLTSDAWGQCANSFGFDPMEWEVYCEGCPAPGVAYQLEADCEHLIYKASVNVSQVNGPMGLQITEMISGETITVTQPNFYNFSTFFGLDSVIQFQVEDMDNVGCTYESEPMVYTRDSCVINSCGLDNYTLCYENDEDRWFTFRSEGNMPVAIYFYQGQMLPGDFIVLYNGLTDAANVILQGNNSGSLAGLTVNSSNADNAITLRVRSNDNGSCADGGATIPLNWDVGCGAVGIEEIKPGSFTLFPNPANGWVSIGLNNNSNGPVTLQVMDMSGRIVLDQVITERDPGLITLDLGMLQSGQYLMRAITRDGVATRSFQMLR